MIRVASRQEPGDGPPDKLGEGNPEAIRLRASAFVGFRFQGYLGANHDNIVWQGVITVKAGSESRGRLSGPENRRRYPPRAPRIRAERHIRPGHHPPSGVGSGYGTGIPGPYARSSAGGSARSRSNSSIVISVSASVTSTPQAICARYRVSPQRAPLQKCRSLGGHRSHAGDRLRVAYGPRPALGTR